MQQSPSSHSRQPDKLKILHLVASLDVGGLERVVFDLTRLTDRSRFEPAVLCLDNAGTTAQRFESARIPVEVLHGEGKSGWANVLLLARRLRGLRPGRGAYPQREGPPARNTRGPSGRYLRGGQHEARPRVPRERAGAVGEPLAVSYCRRLVAVSRTRRAEPSRSRACPRARSWSSTTAWTSPVRARRGRAGDGRAGDPCRAPQRGEGPDHPPARHAPRGRPAARASPPRGRRRACPAGARGAGRRPRLGPHVLLPRGPSWTCPPSCVPGVVRAVVPVRGHLADPARGHGFRASGGGHRRRRQRGGRGPRRDGGARAPRRPPPPGRSRGRTALGTPSGGAAWAARGGGGWRARSTCAEWCGATSSSTSDVANLNSILPAPARPGPCAESAASSTSRANRWTPPASSACAT